MDWVYIFLIVFISAFLKGTTGFGFALVSVPLFLFFYSPKFFIPIICLYNLVSSLIILAGLSEFKANKKTFILPFWGSIGILIGTVFLKLLPEFWLKILISGVLIFLSVAFLGGYRFRIKNMRRATMIAGLTSGFTGGSISISGPPLALFLTSLNYENNAFRHVFAWFSIIASIFAMLAYWILGLVSLDSLKVFISYLPALLLGVYTGNLINNRMSVKVFQNICILITLIAGIMVLYSCFIIS